MSVSPRIAPEPATISFLLTGLELNRTACFELDGANYYWSCKDATDRKSLLVEFKNVPSGSYVARALVDGKVTPTYEVTITSTGPN